MVKIAVMGVGGKTGGAILRLALEDPALEVAGAAEASGHPLVGRTIGEVAGRPDQCAIVTSNPEAAITECDVVVDFTSPAASRAHFRIARSSGKAVVIGTTGFEREAIREIQEARDTRIVLSPNMSVGVNVMFDLVGRLSGLLKDDYDVEIVEIHHRWKKDAPSGTALRLKECIEKAQPGKAWVQVSGREGIVGERKQNEIAVLSLRGGDVVGEHTVTFAGLGERLEVTHRAHTRDNFARGALIAAKWIVARDPGLYSMQDVLGL
jgi:4-hydroxy-tetrahydrodipicolinate reductase